MCLQWLSQFPLHLRYRKLSRDEADLCPLQKGQDLTTKGAEVMIYTVEQAKEIWCPHVKKHSSGNTGRVVDIFNCCKANKCSAWRWVALNTKVLNGMGGERINPPAGEYGYCGLAGKPEG